MDRERDLTSDMFNSLTKSQQDNILIEPFFLVDGKPFRFDFMSKSDYNLVTKLVNSINVGLEKQKNLTENIDTKLNNNENKNDIEDLRNTLLAEMLELKNSFTNTLKLTDKKLITVKEFEEMYSDASSEDISKPRFRAISSVIICISKALTIDSEICKEFPFSTMPFNTSRRFGSNRSRLLSTLSNELPIAQHPHL